MRMADSSKNLLPEMTEAPVSDIGENDPELANSLAIVEAMASVPGIALTTMLVGFRRSVPPLVDRRSELHAGPASLAYIYLSSIWYSRSLSYKDELFDPGRTIEKDFLFSFRFSSSARSLAKQPH